VAAALAGGQDAYYELVQRYQRPLYALIARMVRDMSLAEDLAQEVFVKAFRSLASYDPSRKFSSWLFKIAHNTAIDQLRRKSLDTEPLEGDGEDDAGPLRTLHAPLSETPEALRHRSELQAAIESAIGGLRSEYREVVLLRFQEGLAYEEIVEITGLPLGTVKTFLHRARKQLAQVLGEQGWMPDG
jgi:RNA polymerase sigma-70 factor, ECF subfamily